MSEFTSCNDCIYFEDAQDKCGECFHNLIDHFTTKPKKKIIDLSMVVGSDIDMEFTDRIEEWITIGKLQEYTTKKPIEYKQHNGHYWAKCRIRQDHWHHWRGGACPLPEGLEVELAFIDVSYDEKNELMTARSYKTTTDYQDDIWKGPHLVGFKVLGPAEDWEYYE